MEKISLTTEELTEILAKYGDYFYYKKWWHENFKGNLEIAKEWWQEEQNFINKKQKTKK